MAEERPIFKPSMLTGQFEGGELGLYGLPEGVTRDMIVDPNLPPRQRMFQQRLLETLIRQFMSGKKNPTPAPTPTPNQGTRSIQDELNRLGI